MIETIVTRLTLESLVNLGNSFLFIGVGDNFELPNKLFDKGKQVLTSDLIMPKNCDTLFIQSDLKDLDYNLLTKKYDTLVLQQLCGVHGAGEVFYQLHSGIWDNFSSIIIEFCDKKEHYLNTSMELLTTNCTDLLKSKGFNTAPYTYDFTRYFLFASKEQLPNKLLPERDYNHSFVNPLTGDGYEHLGWEGPMWD